MMNRLRIPLLAAMAIVAFISCPMERNNPYDPNAAGFYDGWQITWQPTVQIYEAFNHTDGNAYRNGFPHAMAIGDNGTFHVVGYFVSTFEYYYIRKPADSDTFDQSTFTVFQTNVRPDISGPADMVMLTENIPALAYIDENASGNDAIYFQEGKASGGFNTADELWSDAVTDPSLLRMFWLPSDILKARFYFLHDGDLKWTIRTGSSTINPDPPEVFIADVITYAAVQVGNDDIAFVYTNTAADAVYFRLLSETTPVTIWESSAANEDVTRMSVALDSIGAFHVCFVTADSATPLDTSKASLRYVTQVDGQWSEGPSIDGTDNAGPSTVFAPTIITTTDRNQNVRVHLIYERLVPLLTIYPWYAYLSDDGWVVGDESIDPDNANWYTMPTAVADDEGNLHVVYSWSESELDRTLMYVKGQAGESQGN